MMTVSAPAETWTRHTFAAMGTVVAVSLPTGDDTSALMGQVEALFGRVERSCTRFDAASDLMRANAEPTDTHDVSPECAAVVAAAHEAYRVTEGLFDPRILGDLVAAGYDRTFAEVTGTAELNAAAGVASSGAAAEPPERKPTRAAWSPRIDSDRAAVTLGPTPIDLGGIGKGWAVDAAAAILAGAAPAFLVNAGGDLAVAGDGPSGDGWTVAVEDPYDPTLTLAVLRLESGSCATSSTGRRRWMQDGKARHHLIDPRTGRPAAGGLESVTVVADTTVEAETWSKALLIAGRDRIQELCWMYELAAYWVTDDNHTGCSTQLIPHHTWERDHDV